MSKKPQLKIDTDFYEGDQEIEFQAEQINTGNLTPERFDERQAATTMFERILSSNLAEKFITCWKQLKAAGFQNIRPIQYVSTEFNRYEEQQPRYQLHRNNSQQFRNLNLQTPEAVTNSRQNFQFNSGKKERDRFHSRQIYTQQRNTRKIQGHNDKRDIHKHHQRSKSKTRHHHNTQQRVHEHIKIVERGQRGLTRSQSADLKAEISRAHMLNKIADKLRQNKHNHCLHQEADVQVIHRISKLEHIIKDIKHQGDRREERDYLNHSRGVQIEKEERWRQKMHDKEDMNRLMDELWDLKRQIKAVKYFNEEKVKNDITKSKIYENYQYVEHQHPIIHPPVIHLPPQEQHRINPITHTFHQKQERREYYKPGNTNFLPAPSLQGNFRHTVNASYAHQNRYQHAKTEASHVNSRPHYQPIVQNSGGSFVMNKIQQGITNQMSGISINPSVRTTTQNHIYSSSVHTNPCYTCGRACPCPPVLRKA